MLTLDGAETVLGYFYFDRTLYGNKEYCKENDIGAGTVTAIIQEARKQEEYNNIDLLRQVSVRIKEEGLELPLLGFVIRLKKIMADCTSSKKF
ncbi:MAG TPA: hypothetical protein VKA95_00930 [Nitrososphaeraceae archaeon]|jgi:hypothetical protein|nr:hypothetical protein [Nitrososphaeraceae archaeon]